MAATSLLRRASALGRLNAPPETPFSTKRNRLFPANTPLSANDTVDEHGGITTTRATSAQRQDQASFDANVLPGLSEHQPRSINNMPSAAAVQADRAARLAKDPYDIGPYAEDSSGTFGSQQRVAPTTAPAARSRPDGLAVKLIGDASPLNSAGALARVQAPPAYNPTSPTQLASLPMNQYAPAPAAIAPEPTLTPAPMATPSAPLPAPVASTAAPDPALAPSPTPTPSPTATPTATPQIMPTPAGARMASGVSNGSAAQFEQPTAANPLPTTPTTPVADVEDYDTKNRTKFTGFGS